MGKGCKKRTFWRVQYQDSCAQTLGYTNNIAFANTLSGIQHNAICRWCGGQTHFLHKIHFLQHLPHKVMHCNYLVIMMLFISKFWPMRMRVSALGDVIMIYLWGVEKCMTRPFFPTWPFTIKTLHQLSIVMCMWCGLKYSIIQKCDTPKWIDVEEWHGFEWSRDHFFHNSSKWFATIQTTPPYCIQTMTSIWFWKCQDGVWKVALRTQKSSTLHRSHHLAREWLIPGGLVAIQQEHALSSALTAWRTKSPGHALKEAKCSHKGGPHLFPHLCSHQCPHSHTLHNGPHSQWWHHKCWGWASWFYKTPRETFVPPQKIFSPITTSTHAGSVTIV